MSSENYVYKKEVDWSLFNYGFAIPLEHQVVFKQIADRRGGLIVDHQLLVLHPVAVGYVSPAEIPLRYALAQAPAHILGEVGRVVFGHGFQ